jgi:hypothetical protein
MYFIDSPIEIGNNDVSSRVEYCIWKFEKYQNGLTLIS